MNAELIDDFKCSTLDVGCGDVKRGDIGIDYDKQSDADIIADIHNLPLRDEVFDKVMSSSVLEHSFNPLVFLREQFRVLKKTGVIELQTDNAQYYRVSVLRFRGRIHEDLCSDHYMIFYPKNVRKLLEKAGFNVLRLHVAKGHWQGRQGKIDLFMRVFIRSRLLRNECLYPHIKVIGTKEA